jgi:DNA-binding protein HU-beta
VVAEEKLDDVALADDGGGLDALAVDLDVAAAAGLGGVATVLEEADQLEPVIDAMSFHQQDIIVIREGRMIKADIVNKVAEVSEISRVKAAQAVDTVIEGLRNALARGQRIELRGFGVFQVKQRKKGIGRNPKTGVEVKIPPGNTIRFKPGKELRNLL